MCTDENSVFNFVSAFYYTFNFFVSLGVSARFFCMYLYSRFLLLFVSPKSVGLLPLYFHCFVQFSLWLWLSLSLPPAVFNIITVVFIRVIFLLFAVLLLCYRIGIGTDTFDDVLPFDMDFGLYIQSNVWNVWVRRWVLQFGAYPTTATSKTLDFSPIVYFANFERDECKSE